MPRRHSPDNPTPADDERPSKTRVKQAMLDLQQLGKDLLDLPVDRLDAIGMDDRLRDALEELRRITAHSARKRQMQYVGKLLRSEDPEPFRKAIESYRAGRRSDAKLLHEAERWRERLLNEATAVDAWFAAQPGSDTPEFRKLIAQARTEAQGMREDPARGRGRYYRELFRALREAIGGAANQP